MEVSDVLKKAWMAVEAADLPDRMHEIAFREAIRLCAPMPPSTAQSLAPVPRAGKSEGASRPVPGSAVRDDGVAVSEDEMYERVAAQTGANRDLLEQVVYLDDDGPRVSVAGLKLGRANSERARAVAQILAISRGFGLGESETSLDVIRAECERLKVYDPANFSSHMKALNGYVISGSGHNRRLRPKGPGIAAFATLLEKILAEAR